MATIALAAGGSGGHLFPAQSVAAELIRRGHTVLLLTDKRGEALAHEIAKQTAITIHILRAASPSKKHPVEFTRSIHELWRGYTRAKSILKQNNVKAVVGFGGYASVPALYAAKKFKIPFLLHEQNTILGRANRIVANAAKKILLSFPKTRFADKADKNLLTGYLVRDAFLQKSNNIYQPSYTPSPIRILAIGGSAGAKIFSDLLPSACALLPDHLHTRLEIIQQCRAEYLEETQKRYDVAKIKVQLSPFFHNILDLMLSSHLIIARSGGTINELITLGLPSILIPLPTSADDHQTANARMLNDIGGAILAPQSALNAEKLAKILNDLLTNPDELAQMAAQAKTLQAPDAAAKVADAINLYLEPTHVRNTTGNTQI